jgi:hypothetical protein
MTKKKGFPVRPSDPVEVPHAHEPPHARCICGHEKIVHVGYSECWVKGCRCREFTKSEPPPPERIQRVKTLDRSEPKLFEVEL